MFLIMFMEILIIVYIDKFKSDFTEEYLEKSQGFVIVTTIIVILLGLLGSL